MAADHESDYLKAAGQRLTAAEALLRCGLTTDAYYLAGYTIECSLKALILRQTPKTFRTKTLDLIRSNAKMHQAEVLFDVLRKLGVDLPIGLVKRLRATRWSTKLR